MKAIYYHVYPDPIGRIGITEDNGHITNLFFEGEEPLMTCSQNGGDEIYEEHESPLIGRAFKQLGEYLAGRRKKFDLPLKLNGTEFLVKDWEALKTIPYGQTCSYKDIAEKIGHPKAYRAVGMANNKNPIAIVIPCHRVIGANGKLVGFGGGLPLKKYLLDLEQNNL